MMYKAEKVAQNTGYYTIALIIQKIVSFGYFSYLATKLGVDNLGTYTFALSFTTIFSVFIDIGLVNVLTREVAKYRDKASKFFATVMSVKAPLSVLTYLAVIITINLMNPNVDVRQLVYISGLIMILDSFTLTFYAMFRGFQNLIYESFGSIGFQVIVAVSGIVIVNITNDLRFVILAVLAGSFFNFLYSLVLLIAKLKIRLTFKADRALTKLFLKITIPFALAGVFTKVYGYIDTVFLHEMIAPAAAGYYSLPYKITFALQFIPLAFIASLYPAFSLYYKEAENNLRQVFEKAMVYLGIIAVPITLGIVSLADNIIISIYSEAYSPSILPLQILILSIPFLFLNFPLGSLLNACDRQKRNTIHIGIVMLINVILNLILIPKFQVAGAAIASSLSTLIMFILQMHVAKQITPYKISFLIKKYSKILLSGLAMYLAIIYLKTYISFLILIPIGAIIYFAILFAVKGFTYQELKTFLNSMVKKVS